MKRALLAGLALVFCLTSFSQEWKKKMQDPKSNFYDTRRAFERYCKKQVKEIRHERRGEEKNAKEEQEIAGYEVFKRWENFMAPRVYPSGDVTQASRAWEEYQTYLHSGTMRHYNPMTQSSTWQAVGPFGDPSGGNAGRINAVRFDPSSSSAIWIVTPDGGLWHTANTGSTWSTLTDQLAVIGCSDVAFHPSNNQVMYLASGDGDAGDSYSIGVLKSTDGGATWNPTGLTWPVSAGNKIYKMLMNPQNPNEVFVASTIGIFRTLDGGATWTVSGASGAQVTDMEYRPGDTTTVYAVSTDFYRSTDGGASFGIVATGLPVNTAIDRLAIAVTPANPAFVYVVGSNATNDGFYGFYQSVDNGLSFTQKPTSLNLLGWSSSGNDTGGQGWYTLSIAASPTNASEVVVGGVNIWRTTSAGTNWSLFGQWTGQGAPYVHADIHDLMYQNATTIYAGTDGGIFQTTNSGTSWNAVNGNMNIAEIYKIGLSKTTYNLDITGHQDNGTNIYSGGWANTMGGDGMACFIDWSNDQVMYGEQYNGSFNVTTNGGVTWNGITSGLTGTSSWVTPWHQDPAVANTIYGGYQQMFKSLNRGNNWTQMGTLPGTSNVVEFSIAPSNSQVMYVIQGNTLVKTSNGGTTWTDITGTLPVANAHLTHVTVKDRDPNRVWVTFSGYSAPDKVYASGDGGLTWTNFSSGLPNLPANCITYWNGTREGMYVGCDVGIYYRDSILSSWVSYSAGLPNVSIGDIQIFYPLGKLRAATFGRGVWEVDLYNNGTLTPLANFSSDKTYICAGMSVNFSDLSSFAPTTWNWTFQGGTPGSSSQQNPSVTYPTPGTYSVSLTCSNANGGNTMTKTVYITVSGVNTLPLAEGFQNGAFPPPNWQNYDAGSDNQVWTANASVGRNSTACMFYDNYNLNSSGIRDEMRSPKYDLSAFNHVTLSFDVAYAQADLVYTDSLAVLVSSDCGVTYTPVYLKGGTTLATAPNNASSLFVPSASQWRRDTVDLSAYAGLGNVFVSFQNRGHYGQPIYIDNVNITGANSHNPPVALFNSPPVTCSGDSLLFYDQSSNIPSFWNWSFPGGSPSASTLQNPKVLYASAGTYTVTLVSSNGAGSSTPATQVIQVSATPVVSYVQTSNQICVNAPAFALSGGSPAGGAYSGTGVSSNTFNPALAGTGSFPVVYTYVQNGCGGTGTQTITVSSCAGIQTLNAGDAGLNVFPNPFNSLVDVQLGGGHLKRTLNIYDVLGKLVYSFVTEEESLELDLGSLEKGVYLLQVSTGKSQIQKRIVKF